MLPQVKALLVSDSDVAGLVGTRVYRHGDAPQNVALPYVTWFLVSGLPENEMSELPKIDAHHVQVDCWSNSDLEVEALATAVRDAIEPEHHMTAVAVNGRDPETKRYRIGMTFIFWTHRP